MAGTNDGGPAFPSPGKDFTVPGGPVDGEFSAPGMTLRDYFAGQALASYSEWFANGRYFPGMSRKLSDLPTSAILRILEANIREYGRDSESVRIVRRALEAKLREVGEQPDNSSYHVVAHNCYAIADAMIAARSK